VSDVANDKINAIACGTAVEIGPEDSPIEAVVSAITIRDRNVSYEVTWWDGRTRKSEWIDRSEVRMPEGQRLVPLGFHFRVD